MKLPVIGSLSPEGRFFIVGEIWPRRWKFAGFLALSLIAGVIEMVGVGLVFPLLMVIVNPASIDRFRPLAWLVDQIGLGRGPALFIFLTALIALIMVMKNTYMVFFNWLQQRTLAHWKASLSGRLMRIYIFSDYRLYLEKTSSEMIRNIALTAMVFDQFMAGLISLLVNGGILLALGVLLVAALPGEAVVGLALVCATAGAIYRTMKKPFEDVGRDINEIFKIRQGLLRQSILMIKETKVMSKERYFLDMFVNVERKNFARTARYNFMSSLPPLIIEGTVIVVILCLVGYILYESGGEAVGLATLGLLAAALFRATPLLNRILTALQMMNLSRNSVEILGEELKELSQRVHIPEHDVPKLPFRSKVELEDVSFSYPASHVPALREVSLTINKNEFIGITGPSGSGKTTLALLLLGLAPPTSGRFLVDGEPLEDPARLRGWQQNLGFVAQGTVLGEGTIADNVAYGEDRKDFDEARIWHVLDIVQLKSFVDKLPKGIHFDLGEEGTRLSGGQRQRLSIARSLYHNPDVLLMDEATAALDVATEQAFSNSLKELQGSRTIVAIAHRLSTLKNCDRIVMMMDGRVIDAAPFDELERRCPEFRRLVQLSRPQQVA